MVGPRPLPRAILPTCQSFGYSCGGASMRTELPLEHRHRVSWLLAMDPRCVSSVTEREVFPVYNTSDVMDGHQADSRLGAAESNAASRSLHDSPDLRTPGNPDCLPGRFSAPSTARGIQLLALRCLAAVPAGGWPGVSFHKRVRNAESCLDRQRAGLIGHVS